MINTTQSWRSFLMLAAGNSNNRLCCKCRRETNCVHWHHCIYFIYNCISSEMCFVFCVKMFSRLMLLVLLLEIAQIQFKLKLQRDISIACFCMCPWLLSSCGRGHCRVRIENTEANAELVDGLQRRRGGERRNSPLSLCWTSNIPNNETGR